MTSASHVVIDTNVVSYFIGSSILKERYRELIAGRTLCVAFVTPEELYFGAEKSKWGQRRRTELEACIADCILLPVNLEIARLSGRIRAERRRAGHPIEPADAWIAATALWHEAPLATHDGDFDDIEGLQVITVRRDLRIHDSVPGSAHMYQ